MTEIKQSTARNEMVFMASSQDHISGATGLTLTITASKDGAAFASISPTVTERGNGWYNLALTSSHTDTLGNLCLHITATGADPADVKLNVVANIEADTYARIGAPAGASMAADIAANETHLTDIKGTGFSKDTHSLPQCLTATGFSTHSAADIWAVASRSLTDKAGFTIAGTKNTLDDLNDLAESNVQTAVDAALDATGAELASIPSTSGSLRQKINYTFQYFRNKRTVTSTTETLYKEDGTTALGTASIADDGTTFTRGEAA